MDLYYTRPVRNVHEYIDKIQTLIFLEKASCDCTKNKGNIKLIFLQNKLIKINNYGTN